MKCQPHPAVSDKAGKKGVQGRHLISAKPGQKWFWSVDGQKPRPTTRFRMLQPVGNGQARIKDLCGPIGDAHRHIAARMLGTVEGQIGQHQGALPRKYKTRH